LIQDLLAFVLTTFKQTWDLWPRHHHLSAPAQDSRHGCLRRERRTFNGQWTLLWLSKTQSHSAQYVTQGKEF